MSTSCINTDTAAAFIYLLAGIMFVITVALALLSIWMVYHYYRRRE